MKSLFERATLRHLTPNNRVARSATETTPSDGRMTERDARELRALAEGGAGLVIGGHMCLCDEGKSGLRQRLIGRGADEDALKRSVDAVHEAGGLLVAQIGHSGFQARYVPPEKRIGPCAREGFCRGASKDELHRVVEMFADAAKRARRAGYDGAQIHAAHGYLISEFLSRRWNQREDEYGGDALGRYRLLREVIEAAQAEAGADYPLLVKLHSDTEIDDETFPDDLAMMLKDMDGMGVEAAELSGVNSCPSGRPKSPYFLKRLAEIRPRTKLPLMLVGGLRNRKDCEDALAAGADMVSFCRPFICQSDWARRLERGEEARCVSCGRCYSFEDGRACALHEEIRREGT